jgi:hypothetical protein
MSEVLRQRKNLWATICANLRNLWKNEFGCSCPVQGRKFLDFVIFVGRICGKKNCLQKTWFAVGIILLPDGYLLRG